MIMFTERYMDLPSENKEGYKFGSAMTHANKYRIVTHYPGTLDDNCHMQNTLQLVDKFASMDKHFELMLYPNERHGVDFPNGICTTKYVQFWFKNFLGKDFINE
ncbi:MAG: prolyl oligopeptidase family serine peptidase [Ignavibacteriales bacterium]|nr:prolyl oligopeptidase family serine peptidase [Ignavibacteriales bacterium]